MALAARSMRSRAPTQSRRQDPTPAGAGGNVGHPQNLPPPARRGAETRTRGSLPSGSQARGRRATSPGAHPSSPAPHQETQLSGERGDWLPASLSTSDLGRSEGGSFVLFKLILHPQELPTTSALLCYLADRQETQRKKKKSTAPLVPSSSLELGGRRGRRVYLFSPA